jgi:hypothetical protein
MDKTPLLLEIESKSRFKIKILDLWGSVVQVDLKPRKAHHIKEKKGHELQNLWNVST